MTRIQIRRAGLIGTSLASLWLLGGGCKAGVLSESESGGSAAVDGGGSGGSSSGIGSGVSSGSGSASTPGSDASAGRDASGLPEGSPQSNCPPTCMVKLAPGPVFDLRIDATHVYWTSWDSTCTDCPGSVMKVPLEGGVATTLAAGVTDPHWIAVGGAAVYWTSPDTASAAIMTVPLSGGAPTVLAPIEQPIGVACDDRNVYWTGMDTGTVWSLPQAGGSPMGVGSTLALPLNDIAVDATSVYVIAGGLFSNSVVRVPLSGGAATTLATGQSANSLAVDAASVYWTDRNVTTGGSVRSVPLGGGSVTTLAAGPGDGPTSIATDGANVYWTDRQTGTVMRVAASGGALTTLASGLDTPAGIAVDGTSVYFGTNDAVMKLAPK